MIEMAKQKENFNFLPLSKQLTKLRRGDSIYDAGKGYSNTAFSHKLFGQAVFFTIGKRVLKTKKDKLFVQNSWDKKKEWISKKQVSQIVYR